MKPDPKVKTGLLSATTWSRATVAERLRNWRREGYNVTFIRPGCYCVQPYIITTRSPQQ